MAQASSFVISAINRKTICDISTIDHDNDAIQTWNNSNRKIIIMRHGERVDTTFGVRWLENSFNGNGEYIQKDLNMPKILPIRNHISHWKRDVPLTNIGKHQAFLTGDGMKEAGVQITYAYCSPVFRCVQTCSEFLSGLGLREKVKIRIEPGFFQYIGWEGLIDVLTPDELYAAGYNIDLEYIPMLSLGNLMKKIYQTLDEHYNNTYNYIQSVIKETEYGNIYICAHGDSLDVCTRKLLGYPAVTSQDIQNIITSVHFCSVVAVEEIKKGNWTTVKMPCPPISHGINKKFDHKLLYS